MRINGIGVTLLGVSEYDNDGNCTATVWFTFIYLPLIPLRRLKVRFAEHKGSGFSYSIISRENLRISEILRTLLFGWVLFPLVIFGPGVLVQDSVWQAIGLPDFIHIPFGIAAVIWVFVSCFKLLDRHEAKCRPKSY